MSIPRPRVVVVGDTAVDVVARHRGPPVHGGDVRAVVRVTSGGAAATTAAWLAHGGVEAILVARIGADFAGEQVRRELTAAGVRCALTVDPDASTGCVVVLVDEHGQRSMLSDRGANARIRDTDLDPGLLRSARHLHLSGYVLLDESSRPAGQTALAAAREAGLSTSVDPQAAAMITDPPTFLTMIAGVDLLLPNTDELAALTGSTDPASAMRLLDVVGAVAVTSGADGASWVAAGGVIRAPAQRTECVDSTGAGDAFDAGLLAAWLGGAAARDSLRAGLRLAATAVSRVGAAPPHPSITG